MKGIVFTEFIEMVEREFSEEMADRLIDECDLPSGGAYTTVGTYDHSELEKMVSRLAELSGRPSSELVTSFGRHMFGRFFALYPSFFIGATSAMTFLSHIEDVIHSEVRKLYPDVELPQFDVEWPDVDTLVLTYHSPRRLGDLAQGLIEACLAHFGETLALRRENLDEAGQVVRFVVSRQK